MGDKWGKCMEKEMRHTAGVQQYSARLWFIFGMLNGEAAGGYGARFNRFAFSMALSMALR